MRTSLFDCTACHGELAIDSNTALCRDCEASFSRIEGAINMLGSVAVDGGQQERSVETDFAPQRKRRGPISEHLGARTTERLVAELAELSHQLGRSLDVLDVGCGTKLDPGRGYSYVHRLEEIARTYRGIDPSAECVAVSARAGSRLERFDAGEVARAAGEVVPLTNDTVDAVVMVSSLDHTADPAKVLNECHRVLRPSGRLIIKSGTHHSWAVQLLRRLFPTRMGTRDAHDHHFHFEVADLAGMIGAAGFSDCHVRECGYVALPPQGRRVESVLAGVGRLAGRKRFLHFAERLDDRLAERLPGYGSEIFVTARMR